MGQWVRIASVVLATTLWSVASAQGGAFVFSHRVCDMPSQSSPPPIPIGCELPDPGVGCSSGQSLSLKLRFEAPDNATATLKMTDAPTGLQVDSGPATGTGNTFVMGPGLVVLTGFVSDAQTVPMVTVTISVPSLQNLPTPTWQQGSAALVKMELTQVVGDYVVDQTSIRDYFYPCKPSGQERKGDKITLNGTSPGSVALLDAKNGNQCGPPYDDYLGKSVIELPSLSARGSCLERMTLYSGNAGLTFRQDPFWTDSQDNRSIGLPQLLKQRVMIWVLYDPCKTPGVPRSACVGSPSEWENRPTRHVLNAMRIYDQEYGGITFDVDTKNLSTNTQIPDLRRLVDNGKLRCYDFDSIKATVDHLRAFTGLTENQYKAQLNVFYLKEGFGYGRWCGVYNPVGRDTILLADSAKVATLAHELGHAFLQSGNHSDIEDAFGPEHAENLMTYEVRGEQLTLGQLFRANLHAESPLYRHQARGLPIVSCSAAPQSPDGCPELEYDVRPR